MRETEGQENGRIMLDVYQNKRREPRVKIHTRVTVSGEDKAGNRFSIDTITVDVSPHGASVCLEQALERGTVVEFATQSYTFRTRAVVRTVDADRSSGTHVVGLEYLDDHVNPVVIWRSPGSDRQTRTG